MASTPDLDSDYSRCKDMNDFLSVMTFVGDDSDH